jgi:hypothetical protein
MITFAAYEKEHVETNVEAMKNRKSNKNGSKSDPAGILNVRSRNLGILLLMLAVSGVIGCVVLIRSRPNSSTLLGSVRNATSSVTDIDLSDEDSPCEENRPRLFDREKYGGIAMDAQHVHRKCHNETGSGSSSNRAPTTGGSYAGPP